MLQIKKNKWVHSRFLGGTIWSSEINLGLSGYKAAEHSFLTLRQGTRERSVVAGGPWPEQQRLTVAGCLAVLLTRQRAGGRVSVTPALWHPGLENVYSLGINSCSLKYSYAAPQFEAVSLQLGGVAEVTVNDTSGFLIINQGGFVQFLNLVAFKNLYVFKWKLLLTDPRIPLLYVSSCLP